MSYADRIKRGEARRARFDRAAVSLPPGVTIEQLQRRIQRLEAENDAIRNASTPALLVPTPDGTLLEAHEYVIEKISRKLKAKELMDVAAFTRELANGPWETVENRNEQDHFGMLQGVAYTVPGRQHYPDNIKKLPSQLAEHFRNKSSFGDATAKYQRNMGAMDVSTQEPDIPMEFKDFKREVEYGARLYANNVDPGKRTRMF